MGGSVKVTSEVGKGTKFIINIKMKCKAKKTNLCNNGFKKVIKRRKSSEVIGFPKIDVSHFSSHKNYSEDY